MTYEQVEELLKGLEYSHREEIDYSHENVVHVILEAVEKGSIEFLNWVVSRKDITPDHHRKEMWYVVKNEEVFNMPTDHLYKEYKIYLQDQNKK